MEPGRYRETAALFARAGRVLPGGIYGHQSPAMLFLSAALDDADVARVFEVTEEAFREVAR